MKKYQDAPVKRASEQKKATVLEKHSIKSGWFTKKPGMKGDC